MKISIVTVTFNSAKTLSETLQSVQDQTFKNIEHLIIDGKSKDNTLQIVSHFSSITKVVSEPDLGVYDAMRKGVDLATGDIIGILNSDDLFFSNETLSEIAKIFEDNPLIDAVYGNISYFNANKPDKVTRYWRSKEYYPNFFDDGYIMPHPSLFLRKRVYDKLGKSYYPYFKISADYELMLRAFKIHHFKPYFTDKTIVKMRMGGDSTRNLWSNITGNKEIYQSWKMNGLKMPFLFYPKRFFYKIKQLFYV